MRWTHVPQNLQWCCDAKNPQTTTEGMYASLAIEGGIGAGKTTFSTWLAQDWVQN